MVWSVTCVKFVNWDEDELILTATETHFKSFGAVQNFPFKHTLNIPVGWVCPCGINCPYKSTVSVYICIPSIGKPVFFLNHA